GLRCTPVRARRKRLAVVDTGRGSRTARRARSGRVRCRCRHPDTGLTNTFTDATLIHPPGESAMSDPKSGNTSINDATVTTDATVDAPQRRLFLKGTAGILASGIFPAVHAQEKIVLRYLGTAV